MFRPELVLVNFESTQVVWLGGFGAACFAADESSIVQQRTEIREGQFGDLRSGGNSLLIKVDRFFGLTKLITELSESSRRMENSLTVGRLQPRQNAMSVYQIGLRPRTIAVLLVQQSYFLIAPRQPRISRAETALCYFQGALTDSDCFRHLIGGAQRIELVVEDSPQVLLAFHEDSPASSFTMEMPSKLALA